ncbi:MAG TPA: hypothetical protein VHC63_17205 [Acidimicrobiales bacterium]|nr:hypothetical protein [Acidimicrobiales bacterium]
MTIRAEYLRADEIARRFDVSVDDVLQSCSVLGFDATRADSLIELREFGRALKSVHREQPLPSRWPSHRRVLVGIAASVAVVLVAAVGQAVSRHDSPATRNAVASQTPAAAYRAQLKSTYNATVSDNATPADYQALAQRLSAITPPAGLQTEHQELVAEAQHAAAVAPALAACTGTATNPPTCDAQQLNAALQATTVVNSLRDQISAP